MSTTEYATGAELADLQSEATERPRDGASKLLKGLFFGFAATVTIGLGLASWYVGTRIVTTEEAAPQNTAVSTPATPIATPPIVTPAPQSTPSTSQETAMADAFWYAVPPPNELFLETAGLGPRRDADFVKELESEGFPARIETTTAAGGTRILVGPFLSHSTLEEARHKLQNAGILAIESAP
jgi:cell division septation protein DedD